MDNDGQLAKLTMITLLEVQARALVRSRENMVRAAAKSRADRQILADNGFVFSDEEIAYVQERDARRNAGDWSILDELKAE